MPSADDVVSADVSAKPFKRPRPVNAVPRGKRRPLKHIIQSKDYEPPPPSVPSYTSIEAPPSTYPTKKICDVTGRVALYSDPRTKLRFADAHAFRVIRNLSAEEIAVRLTLRGAETNYL